MSGKSPDRKRDPSADGGAERTRGRDESDRSPARWFVAELGVLRNVKIALAVSTAITLALYVYQVVLPGETLYSPALYALLAFVVLFALATSLTILLTAHSAWKLVRDA